MTRTLARLLHQVDRVAFRSGVTFRIRKVPVNRKVYEPPRQTSDTSSQACLYSGGNEPQMSASTAPIRAAHRRSFLTRSLDIGPSWHGSCVWSNTVRTTQF